MKITRAILGMITADIEVAIAGIAAKYEGLKITRGNARFNELEATFKLKLQVVNDEGESESERRDFDTLARSYGLLPEDLGTEFRFRGKLYRLTGINPRARKYPIKGDRVSDKKKFKFPKSATRSIRIVHHTS